MSFEHQGRVLVRAVYLTVRRPGFRIYHVETRTKRSDATVQGDGRSLWLSTREDTIWPMIGPLNLPAIEDTIVALPLRESPWWLPEWRLAVGDWHRYGHDIIAYREPLSEWWWKAKMHVQMERLRRRHR